MNTELQNAIQSHIVLVYVNISVWTGAKRDKALAVKASRREGANDDACSVTKYLVDKTMIDKVASKASAIRQAHYAVTVAWDDNGGRALPTDRWFEYQDTIQKLMEEFDAECSIFCEWYANNWQYQAGRLGNMFNADEYPHPNEMREKFRFKYSFRPILTPDFRTTLPESVLDAVKDSMAQGMQDGIKMATAECWGRVKDCMEKVYVTLDDPKKVFRNSLIENVEILCDTLKSLNLAGDAYLTETLADIEREIASSYPDILRVDMTARSQVAASARKFHDVACLKT